MHVIYLITHKARLLAGTPPYYYIGSKWNYEGEGTYYGSSRSSILKNADKSDLDFKILHQFENDTITKVELLNMERDVQIEHDAIMSEDYFNMTYANGAISEDSVRKQASLSFKELANSVDENGVPYKYKWAQKARYYWNTEEGKARKEWMSILNKQRLASKYNDDLTVAQEQNRRSYEVMSQIGEDGLTGYQRCGKKLSEALAVVGEDGLTMAQRHGLKRRKKRIIGGLTFESTRQAKDYFNLETKKSLDLLEQGYISLESYNIFVNRFGKDFADQFEIIKSRVFIPVKIEEFEFYSKSEAQRILQTGEVSINKYLETGIVGKYLQKALDAYRQSISNEGTLN